MDNSATLTVLRGSSPVNLDGGLTQAATGILGVDVTAITRPGIDYSQLKATGTVKLAGVLSIASPAIAPAVGTKLTILIGAAVTGHFSEIRGAQMSGRHWEAQYTRTSVTLNMVTG